MLGVIGEILVDLTGKETSDGLSFTRHAGGAPFNVALAAKRLGAKVGFFGSVGDDMMGHYLEAFAKAQGFDELALSVLPDTLDCQLSYNLCQHFTILPSAIPITRSACAAMERSCVMRILCIELKLMP